MLLLAYTDNPLLFSKNTVLYLYHQRSFLTASEKFPLHSFYVIENHIAKAQEADVYSIAPCVRSVVPMQDVVDLLEPLEDDALSNGRVLGAIEDGDRKMYEVFDRVEGESSICLKVHFNVRSMK